MQLSPVRLYSPILLHRMSLVGHLGSRNRAGPSHGWLGPKQSAWWLCM